MCERDNAENREFEVRRALCCLIIKTNEYAETDPGTALVKARMSVELICRQAHLRVTGDQQVTRLEMLLQRLNENGALPARLMMPLRTVQLYGNFGAHPRIEPVGVDYQFILPCLIALAQVVRWYFVEFLRESLPAGLNGKLDYGPSGAGGPNDITIELGAEKTATIPFALCETFGEFLDIVWCGLDSAPPPFTYGGTWVLRSQTGKDLQHAREFIDAEHGTPVDDLRTLEEAGIEPGDCLSVIRVGRQAE